MIEKLDTLLTITRGLVLGSFFVIVAMLFIYSPSFADIAIYIIFSLVSLVFHLFFFHVQQLMLHRSLIAKLFRMQLGEELVNKLTDVLNGVSSEDLVNEIKRKMDNNE